jgi:hypothetical protein
MKIAGVVSGGKNSSIHRFKMRFGEKERNCVMEKRGIEARRGVYISLKPQKNTCTASHTLRTATIAAHTTAKTAKPARNEMLKSIF